MGLLRRQSIDPRAPNVKLCGRSDCEACQQSSSGMLIRSRLRSTHSEVTKGLPYSFRLPNVRTHHRMSHTMKIEAKVDLEADDRCSHVRTGVRRAA